jgi:hypothetical protein
VQVTCISFEVASRLRKGLELSALVLTEAPEGWYRISPFDPELRRQMELVEEGLRRCRNTLKERAK